jgi:hypothetical protein
MLEQRSGATILAALVLVACSSGTNNPAQSDGGSAADGGATTGPLPEPLIRMDDGMGGLTHENAFDGVVAVHRTVDMVPAALASLSPSRVLSVRVSDGTTREVYYTLPKPFAFNAAVGDQVHVVYRERSAGFGSSFGLRVESLLDRSLRVLVEDGAIGSVFDDAPAGRLNFTFERDTQQLGSETAPCGQEVHYPGIIGEGTERKRLFPGDTSSFALTSSPSVSVAFTLLDLYHIDNSSCGAAPDYSIAYIVKPSM